MSGSGGGAPREGSEAPSKRPAAAREGLQVTLEPEARDYLRESGGHVTVRASRRHGCCGGTAFLPMADAGRPDDLASFMRWEDGDVTVWLSRRFMDPVEDGATGSDTAAARAPFPIRIGLDRFLGFRRLRVEGPGITT